MLKPERLKEIGLGLIGAAAIPVAIGIAEQAGRQFALSNPWLLVALLFVILGMIAIWVGSRRGTSDDERTANPSITQKFMEVGQGASLDHTQISDNLMINTASSTGRTARKVYKPSPNRRTELAARGESLAAELFEFGSVRRAGEPEYSFSGASLTPEERHEGRSSDVAKRMQYQNETKSQYEARFVGRIAEFLDEAQEIGVEIKESFVHLYPHLAGASPIQEIAREISIIVGRIRRAG